MKEELTVGFRHRRHVTGDSKVYFDPDDLHLLQNAEGALLQLASDAAVFVELLYAVIALPPGLLVVSIVDCACRRLRSYVEGMNYC